MDKITFTLKSIRQHRPWGLERGSGEGYDLLRKNLGKYYGDNTPVTITQIYESNGYDGAWWCLQASDEKFHPLWGHIAVDCAKQVEHLLTCESSKKALVVARDFADGRATEQERYAARAAAVSAALSAVRDDDGELSAALSAVRDAALSAVRATRGDDAAMSAALSAVRAAAWAPGGAWYVAGAAALSAVRASTGHPWYVAWAAGDAAWYAAWAAGDAVLFATRSAQMRLLQDYCRLGERPANSVGLLAQYIKEESGAEKIGDKNA